MHSQWWPSTTVKQQNPSHGTNCTEAHPLSSCSPCWGTFSMCRFETKFSKSSCSPGPRCYCCHQAGVFFMRRTLLKPLNASSHDFSSFSGSLPQPSSLLPSAQLYHNIWAKFILFVIDFSGFHRGLFGVPLLSHHCDQHPERIF